ncbi:MAG: diguanylate cyclase [Geminicoccaceae bacterium]
MRGGLRCCVIEAFPGSLAGLAEALAGWGIACQELPANAGESRIAGAAADAFLVDTGSHAGTQALRRLTAARHDGGPPVVALCRNDAVTAISQALASGCDDAIVFPLDEIELEVRVRALSALVVAERERDRRSALLADYAPGDRKGRTRQRQERAADRPQVLLAGPPSDNQVRVANGLGPASIAYADSQRSAQRMLGEREFDLVVATLPGTGVAPTLRPADLEDLDVPLNAAILLAGPVGEDAIRAALEQGFNDVLPLPQAPELIRLRLELWLRLQRLRGWLRDPVDGVPATLAQDSLSGLFNRGFVLDYLATALRGRPAGAPLVVLGVAIRDLAELGHQHGHALANRLVAGTGRMLRYLVRAEDLAGHMGEGEFAVVMEGASEPAAQAIANRIRTALARISVETRAGRQMPIEVGTGVVAITRAEDVERLLARTFRDIAGSRRQVA